MAITARDVKVTVSACGTVLTYTFSTAWAPPEPWAKKAWARAIAQSIASLHMELKYTLEGEDDDMITAAVQDELVSPNASSSVRARVSLL